LDRIELREACLGPDGLLTMTITIDGGTPTQVQVQRDEYIEDPGSAACDTKSAANFPTEG
jgi:hypothetical protein